MTDVWAQGSEIRGLAGRGICLMLLSVSLMASAVCADEVVLSNGDVLHGRIRRVWQQQVECVSGPLGTLSIGLDKVRTLETSLAVPVLLEEAAQPVRARMLRGPEGSVTLEAEGERRVVPLCVLEAAGIAVEEALVKRHASRREPVRAALAEDRFAWSGTMEAGLNGRQGNTERVSVNGGIKVLGKKGLWTVTGHMAGVYGEQEIDGRSEVSDNEVKGGCRVQKQIGDGFFSAFGQVNLERDRIEELDLRAVGNGGLGLRWIKTEELFWETRLGIGYQQAEYESGRRTRSIVGDLTSDVQYKVNAHVDLSQRTTWIPDLDDLAAYRVTSESAAILYFNTARTLFLKSGLQHNYDNQPASTKVERLDTYYFTNVGWKF